MFTIEADWLFLMFFFSNFYSDKEFAALSQRLVEKGVKEKYVSHYFIFQLICLLLLILKN